MQYKKTILHVGCKQDFPLKKFNVQVEERRVIENLLLYQFFRIDFASQHANSAIYFHLQVTK